MLGLLVGVCGYGILLISLFFFVFVLKKLLLSLFLLFVDFFQLWVANSPLGHKMFRQKWTVSPVSGARLNQYLKQKLLGRKMDSQLRLQLHKTNTILQIAGEKFCFLGRCRIFNYNKYTVENVVIINIIVFYFPAQFRHAALWCIAYL